MNGEGVRQMVRYKLPQGERFDLSVAPELTSWDAGPLQNAVVVEGLTSILIGINQRYKIKAAGVRITGEPVENRADPEE